MLWYWPILQSDWTALIFAARAAVIATSKQTYNKWANLPNAVNYSLMQWTCLYELGLAIREHITESLYGHHDKTLCTTCNVRLAKGRVHWHLPEDEQVHLPARLLFVYNTMYNSMYNTMYKSMHTERNLAALAANSRCLPVTVSYVGGMENATKRGNTPSHFNNVQFKDGTEDRKWHFPLFLSSFA